MLRTVIVNLVFGLSLLLGLTQSSLATLVGPPIYHPYSDLIERLLTSSSNWSMYELYQLNRSNGTPNYITEDFVLLNYSLLQAEVWKDTEEKQLLPAFQSLLRLLEKRISQQTKDTTTATNLKYLAILGGLLVGEKQLSAYPEKDSIHSEYQNILQAKAVMRSPMWGQVIDYTQFKPRGAYTRSEQAERYFRTMRYAGTTLFAVTASSATGVDDCMANRLVTQAVRLINLLENDKEISQQYQLIMSTLADAFGQADDVSNETVLRVIKPSQKVNKALREQLAKSIHDNAEEPRILGGVVDKNALAEGQTAQAVLAGWRFMPQRYTPSSAAFQNLVFDNTGKFTGEACDDCAQPFGLTVIDGQSVKGFPQLDELMAMLGSDRSTARLLATQEQSFEGYAEAFQEGKQVLAKATGLQRARISLLQSGILTSPENEMLESNRLNALKGFWTWDRYSSLLYAKQSYTLTSKSISFELIRPVGGWLDPSVELYRALRNLVTQHQLQMPDPRWMGFGAILDRLIDIAYQERLVGLLGGEQGQYLNQLDKELYSIIGNKDKPIIVDVHTNTASEEVLEEATGLAQVVELHSSDLPDTVFQGARFTQYEFKQPMAKRMTLEEWQLNLRENDCCFDIKR
jgi:hypothetical protein